MPRPPVRIAMASYEKVTTMCGEKRSLRQVDRALGAMFTNVGLHPVSLTQTMGPTLGGLTGESTSVIPLSPQGGKYSTGYERPMFASPTRAMG